LPRSSLRRCRLGSPSAASPGSLISSRTPRSWKIFMPMGYSRIAHLLAVISVCFSMTVVLIPFLASARARVRPASPAPITRIPLWAALGVDRSITVDPRTLANDEDCRFVGITIAKKSVERLHTCRSHAMHSPSRLSTSAPVLGAQEIWRSYRRSRRTQCRPAPETLS